MLNNHTQENSRMLPTGDALCAASGGSKRSKGETTLLQLTRLWLLLAHGYEVNKCSDDPGADRKIIPDSLEWYPRAVSRNTALPRNRVSQAKRITPPY